MLKEWGRVSQADLDRVDDLFNTLDRDGGGTLGYEDIDYTRRSTSLHP